MGCGQSKILIYHRKSKADKNDKDNSDGRNDSGGEAGDASDERSGGCSNTSGGPDRLATGERHLDLESQGSPHIDVHTNLLDASEISTSQIDFFKMLDEKIESGADYEEDELEREQERQRKYRLLNEWLRRPHPQLQHQLDPQRFPTAYQMCPPPRFTPRQPLNPQPHPYTYARAISVETAELYNHDRYMDHRREEDMYAERYGIPQEPAYGYSRSMIQSAAAYVSPLESADMSARSRTMGPKLAGRAVSFDVDHYVRHLSESESPVTGPDYQHRGRDMHYPLPPPQHMQYVQHSALQFSQPPLMVPYGMAANLNQEQMHYMARPPPREMPPLQGVPGPPHGSPRPVAVRLPTSVSWRRPRGPVTELA